MRTMDSLKKYQLSSVYQLILAIAQYQFCWCYFLLELCKHFKLKLVGNLICNKIQSQLNSF